MGALTNQSDDSVDTRGKPAQASAAGLETRVIGDIVGRFVVPDYQRGYRWGPHEVDQLLTDIKESIDKKDDSYYLQPIVVRRRGAEWELVDGQQRLTTLYLLMQYMVREGLQGSGPAYSLRYETRHTSAEFLDHLDASKAQHNIDFYHLSEAHRTIAAWFERHGHRRQHVANRIYDALFESVKVIWYEAADDVDAPVLFARLNVGRIPLTDAELIKALLLTRVGQPPAAEARAIEIAAQWDTFERDLRDPELWAFISGRAAESPTHLSLLLDTMADAPPPPRP